MVKSGVKMVGYQFRLERSNLFSGQGFCQGHEKQFHIGQNLSCDNFYEIEPKGPKLTPNSVTL